MAQDTKTPDHTIPAGTPREEPELGERHPLAPLLGVFKDDPMLDAVMEEVYENRRRLQAEMDAAEEDLAA